MSILPILHERIVVAYLSVHRLSRPERVELLRRLKERGALNARAAVEQIARSLRVDRAAVYNHLQEID